MQMTFKDYIRNPMGIKSSVYSHRDMYKELYKKKWDAIKLREGGDIEYTLYKSRSNYYIHFKIPSEVVKDFYYDVVIMFYVPKDGKIAAISTSLDEYAVKFFSNDPSFVFTFAYAFNKNKLFIDDLSSKMSKVAIKQKANMKNPDAQVGYVKSLFFAFLEMQHKNLFSKARWSVAENYNDKKLLKEIEDADSKIYKRQNKISDNKAENKKAKETKAKSIISSKNSPTNREGVKSNINIIGKKKPISKIGKIKPIGRK